MRAVIASRALTRRRASSGAGIADTAARAAARKRRPRYMPLLR